MTQSDKQNVNRINHRIKTVLVFHKLNVWPQVHNQLTSVKFFWKRKKQYFEIMIEFQIQAYWVRNAIAQNCIANGFRIFLIIKLCRMNTHNNELKKADIKEYMLTPFDGGNKPNFSNQILTGQLNDFSWRRV